MIRGSHKYGGFIFFGKVGSQKGGSCVPPEPSLATGLLLLNTRSTESKTAVSQSTYLDRATQAGRATRRSRCRRPTEHLCI